MWYSSGRDLSDTVKYQQLANDSLEIRHVTEQDAGEYECTASNKLGRKTVIRRLKVKSMCVYSLFNFQECLRWGNKFSLKNIKW